MRVALNCADNQIHIDGKLMQVDCTSLREVGISAIQWYGDRGEVEYKGHMQPNALIKSFKPYQDFVDMAEPWPEPRILTPQEHAKQYEEWLKNHPEHKAAIEAENARIQALVDQA